MQQIPPQENELKETIMSFKDSGIDFLKSKSELAAIESKEAAIFAKNKLVSIAIMAFFGIFTYALFLILLHSLLVQCYQPILLKAQVFLPLSGSQVILLVMFALHLILLLIFVMKQGMKPKAELFALTKSELKKDQVWLQEMNNNAN